MNKTIGILAIALATALGTAACGGGTAMQSAAPAAGTTAAPAAMPSDSMAADGMMSESPDAMASDGMESGQAMGAAGGAMASDSMAADGMDDNMAAPQKTVMEEDMGNDGAMSKLPQGMTLAKAKVAGLGKDHLQVVSIVATDTKCTPNKTKVVAGKVWFTITNKGMKINELYLETSKGKELIEVEKIKEGQAGAFKATVKKGSYLIACEPGMADKQIRTPLTVTAPMM